MYIPLAPQLLEILSKKDLMKTSNQSGTSPIDFSTTLKLSKTVLGARIYQDGAFQETLKT